MFTLIYAMALFAHVPTYDGCIQKCCKPPRPHPISQVVYLKGAGGLELHTDEFGDDTILDIDAIFRDETDPSTYDLYVGCGGCVPGDPIVVPPLVFGRYQPAEVEPFTQTAYRSVFPPGERTYHTRRLQNCTQGHFTIRLVQHANATRDVVWGAVIGLQERFTLGELLAFPVFILRNHGSVWNEMGFTIWLWGSLGGVLFFANLHRVTHVRSAFYLLGAIGFAVAACEEVTHLVYAQTTVGGAIGWGFWTGLLLVVGLAQGIGFALSIVIWSNMSHPFWGHPFGGVFEVLLGLGLLICLGSGFYLGPVCFVVTGCIRMSQFEA